MCGASSPFVMFLNSWTTSLFPTLTLTVHLSLLGELYQQVMHIPLGVEGACVHMEMDTMMERVLTSALVAGRWVSLLKWKSYLPSTVACHVCTHYLDPSLQGLYR